MLRRDVMELRWYRHDQEAVVEALQAGAPPPMGTPPGGGRPHPPLALPRQLGAFPPPQAPPPIWSPPAASPSSINSLLSTASWASSLRSTPCPSTVSAPACPIPSCCAPWPCCPSWQNPP